MAFGVMVTEYQATTRRLLERGAVAGEAEGRLRQGLERLSRMQREVFLLRAQQGLDYEEIAAALETSPGAARVHYHHAVKRLKEYLS